MLILSRQEVGWQLITTPFHLNYDDADSIPKDSSFNYRMSEKKEGGWGGG